eukprot:TRINITY_DN46680_c0_g1_i1.p1 TRINITY_DN46680_c0_g1~~TRINITY_DN46680_c0_g1_i1.p1  ORF type:complete len:448 (-),score=46.39 TRINITY_DN46680_c0_g1_i1:212-1555(-)
MDAVRKLMYRCLMRSASQIDKSPLAKVLINRYLPECSSNLDNLITAFLLDQERKFYVPSPLLKQSVRDRVKEAFRFPLQGSGEEVNYDSLGFEAMRYLSCIVRVAQEIKISKQQDNVRRQTSEEPSQSMEIVQEQGGQVELAGIPKPGYVLVAHPILDGYFERTVILLTRHDSKNQDISWQGLVLNRPLQLQLKDVEYKQEPEKVVAQGVAQTESGQEVFIPIVAEVVPGEQGGDSVMEVIAVQLEQEDESQQASEESKQQQQQQPVNPQQKTRQKRGKKSSQITARSSVMQHQTQVIKHFLEYKKHFGLHLVSDGGPVWLKQSIIHTLHDFQQSGQQKIFIGDDDINIVFYSGQELQAKKLIKLGQPSNKQIRFFVGECCWYPGQLEKELKEGAWFLVKATDEVLRVLSHGGSESLWERLVMKLGGEYRQMVTLPTGIMSLPQWQQ